MRDSTERDLAVADTLGEMADERIKELEAENAALREQLAGDGTDYKKLARELALIVDVGTSDDPGTALSKLRKIQHDTATAMRDLCVEKVKLIADEWQMLWEKDLTGDHSEKIVYVQAANQIILALESLTLDQVEQKQK